MLPNPNGSVITVAPQELNLPVKSGSVSKETVTVPDPPVSVYDGSVYIPVYNARQCCTCSDRETVSLTGLAEVNAPVAKKTTGTPFTGTGGVTEKLENAPSAPCNEKFENLARMSCLRKGRIAQPVRFHSR